MHRINTVTHGVFARRLYRNLARLPNEVLARRLRCKAFYMRHSASSISVWETEVRELKKPYWSIMPASEYADIIGRLRGLTGVSVHPFTLVGLVSSVGMPPTDLKRMVRWVSAREIVMALVASGQEGRWVVEAYDVELVRER